MPAIGVDKKSITRIEIPRDNSFSSLPHQAMAKQLHLGVVGAGAAVEKAQAGIQLFDTVSITHLEGWCVDYPSSYERHLSLDSLLAVSELDALYIATPVESHATSLLAAIEYGVPTLIEKPMLLHSTQSFTFRGRDTSRVRVAFKKRYSDATATIRSVGGGSWGPGASFLVRWFAPHPGANHWKLDKAKAGGGVFIDVGSHMLDLAEHLFGALQIHSPPEIVFQGEYGTESYFRLEAMSEQGVHVMLEGGWATEESYQMIEFLAPDMRVEWRKDDRASGQILRSQIRGQTHDTTLSSDAEYVAMFGQLVKFCKGDADNLPRWEAGIRNLEMVERVYELAGLNEGQAH